MRTRKPCDHWCVALLVLRCGEVWWTPRWRLCGLRVVALLPLVRWCTWVPLFRLTVCVPAHSPIKSEARFDVGLERSCVPSCLACGVGGRVGGGGWTGRCCAGSCTATRQLSSPRAAAPPDFYPCLCLFYCLDKLRLQQYTTTVSVVLPSLALHKSHLLGHHSDCRALSSSCMGCIDDHLLLSSSHPMN